MSYYVSIGGITLYGVTEVEETSGREMQEYDGIGSGKFPVPENRDMHTWVISCLLTEKNDYNLPHWRAASEIFRLFEVLLNTKDPSNFILTSKGDYTATSGYLESYVKNEKFTGVFEVSVKIRENRVVGVRTTDVPYIARPGKKPVPPKVTVKKGGNAYSTVRETTGDDPPAPTKAVELATQGLNTLTDRNKKGETGLQFTDPKTGKPKTNAALVGEGDKLVADNYMDKIAVENQAIIDSVSNWFEDKTEAISPYRDKNKKENEAIINGIKNTFSWIGDKINEFRNNFG